MSSKPDHKAIAETINALLAEKPEERVYDGISSWIDAGIFDHWKDNAGRSLSHFAAAWGDDALIEKLQARSALVSIPDSQGLRPADIARAFGHDKIAEKLSAMHEEQNDTKKTAAPVYHSLQDIREAAKKTGENIFYEIASRREFEKVTCLASKDPEGLTAEDLLSQNKYGDTVLLALCRQGSIGLILQKSLWEGRSAVFDEIWTNIPDAYKKGADGGGILSQIRQGKVISRRPPRAQRLRK